MISRTVHRDEGKWGYDRCGMKRPAASSSEMVEHVRLGRARGDAYLTFNAPTKTRIYIAQKRRTVSRTRLYSTNTEIQNYDTTLPQMHRFGAAHWNNQRTVLDNPKRQRLKARHGRNVSKTLHFVKNAEFAMPDSSRQDTT
ncbi:hypothetical protein Tco_0210230 [Tanacetum coccineum]